jgi:7-cyano-7-deazaguanine synthase in queuosine biosynthesis
MERLIMLSGGIDSMAVAKWYFLNTKEKIHFLHFEYRNAIRCAAEKHAFLSFKKWSYEIQPEHKHEFHNQILQFPGHLNGFGDINCFGLYTIMFCYFFPNIEEIIIGYMKDGNEFKRNRTLVKLNSILLMHEQNGINPKAVFKIPEWFGTKLEYLQYISTDLFEYSSYCRTAEIHDRKIYNCGNCPSCNLVAKILDGKTLENTKYI